MTNNSNQVVEGLVADTISSLGSDLPGTEPGLESGPSVSGGYVGRLITRARRLLAPALIAGTLATVSSQASAQSTPANTTRPAVTPDRTSAESTNTSGSASAGIQYFSTSYRKGSNLRLQLNGPKLGPIAPSVSATLASAGATGLAPALSLNAGTSVPLTSRGKGLPPYLAISPSINTGLQFIFPGLDSEKTSESLLLPFVGAALNMPMTVTLDAENSTYLTFSPSATFVRYVRTNDYELKVDDKNGDGAPDFMRPKQQLYFGLTTGVNYDKSFVNASLYYDPFDPSVEKANGRSVFGYLNVGRNF